jgi:hypothetical protein
LAKGCGYKSMPNKSSATEVTIRDRRVGPTRISATLS